MRRIFSLVLALVLMVFIFDSASVVAYALNENEDNNTMANANSFTLGDDLTGAISIIGDIDFYKLVLESSGRVSIKFYSYMQYYSLVLYDSDGNKLWVDNDNTWDSSLGVLIQTHNIDLEKGAYYLKVTSEVGDNFYPNRFSTGTYKMVTSFVSASANNSEPNNNMVSASPISIGSTVKGQIAINDSLDFYKITIFSPSKLNITFYSYMKYYSFIIYDSDGNKLWVDSDNTLDPSLGVLMQTHNIDLEKGVYYIKVTSEIGENFYPNRFSTGNYSFILSDDVKVKEIEINFSILSIPIGGTKQLTATVTPSNATNKAVTWSSSNTSVATVSSAGLVTAKAVGKATVTCKAKDGSNKTATCTVTVIPKTPTGVKAASASYNSVKISWTAVSGATGYYVYRAASKTGTYTNLGSVTSASFIDKKAATGTTYYYKVRAYKTVGSTKYYSGYSAIVSAKAVPAVPASFTAAKASTTSVKTTWKAVTGATGYEVWMATSSSGTYSKITTTAKTTYTKTKLTKNKTYYFKVRAYKTVGKTKVYGSFTSVKSAKPS